MKALSRFLILSPLLSLVVTACGGSNFEILDQAGLVKTTSPVLEEAMVYEEDGYEIVRGGMRFKNVEIPYDKKKKTISLKGRMNLSRVGEVREQNFEFTLKGQFDEQGFAVLRPEKNAGLPSEMKLAAKATCLGKKGDCSRSFIDIYMAYKGLIFHEQIESKTAEVKKEKELPHPPVAHDDEEPENDEAEMQGGRYVGNQSKDIRDLLDVEPKKDSKPSQKVSQAIDQVNNGHLENAVSALEYQEKTVHPGFYIMRPYRKSHFGSNELLYAIRQMGTYTRTHLPEYILPIGDMSHQEGGKIGRHKSHQNGLDVDVGYYFESKNLQRTFTSAVTIDKPHGAWLLDEQWGLYKMLTKTQLVDRIFIHKTLKKALCQLAVKNKEISEGDSKGEVYETLRRLISDTEHNTHFHLRLKCSQAQIRCRPLPEPAKSTGCF